MGRGTAADGRAASRQSRGHRHPRRSCRWKARCKSKANATSCSPDRCFSWRRSNMPIIPSSACCCCPPISASKAKPGPDPYLHQRLELNLSQYYPMQVWTVDDLPQHRAESALIEPDETLKDLRAGGYSGGDKVLTAAAGGLSAVAGGFVPLHITPCDWFVSGHDSWQQTDQR